jgi:uncharacterized repeat protein (TIGR01451 family)
MEGRQLLSAYTVGDVFASVSNGRVQEFTPTGTLVQTLTDGTGSTTTGSAFDSTNNFYVTDFDSGVSKFDNNGNLVGPFAIGSTPESILFDAAGNVYVGQADGTRQILKFDPNGNLLASFSPAVEDRGTDWIDLAADQKTMFYTSEGHSVKTFDVSTNTQGTDFATGLPGSAAYALRLLPDGGALVADTEEIVRLDKTGAVVQTYDATGEDNWFALNLDPNGTSFWSADFGTADVKEFNIATGAVENSFNTGTGGFTVFGLSVFGEITQAKSTDLSIDKIDSPDPVSVGQNLTYTITVTNHGPNDSSGSTVVDTLPAGVTYDSTDSSPGGTFDSLTNTVTYNVGALADGSSTTLTLVVQPTSAVAGTTITNTATVKSNEGDPIPDNNTATVTTTVNAAVVTVPIDIKPGSLPNSINRQNEGNIPVAILGSATFDVHQVVVSSLTFGHAGNENSLIIKNNGQPQVSFEDVNGDGYLDLVAHFNTQLTNFQLGDTVGILEGTLLSGQQFTGQDSVRIVH